MYLDLSALKQTNNDSSSADATEVSESSNENILEQIYIFEGFPQEFRDSIIARCDRELFSVGEEIIREGDESNGKAYIILSGSAEVLRKGKMIARLSVGDIFGEYALICAESRTATVRVIDPIECLILDEDTIIRISNENNQINDIMIARINENAGTAERTESM